MKILSTCLLAGSLVALSACGGGAANNVAANNSTDEVYNVAPDELGTDNGLGNAATGNDTADANASGGDNASTGNSTGNAQ
jgi:hypothetical protein